jgi:hypothetical protein
MISRSAFGVWRMRARLFARHDHLIGRDDGARGRVAAACRVLHDQVAPLGELGVDQPAGSVERTLGLGVAPDERLERLLRLRPERWRRLGPAGAEADRLELLVKVFKRAGLRELLRRRTGHADTLGTE